MDLEGYVKVGEVKDLLDSQALVLIHDTYKIAIYSDRGKYYAIEDICPHMGAFLSNGYQEGNLIVCPWHNWEFELDSGKCVKPVNNSFIKTFPLKVWDGFFWLPSKLCEENEGEFDDWV
jgi:nitrite reductase/ring-hydroxylating ferredoxin subunit